jgi:hypothetical protein
LETNKEVHVLGKVYVEEGVVVLKTFSDGTKGRFDCRDSQTIYVSLEDHLGVFYKEKLMGTIEEMNERLEKFEIVLEYTEEGV